MIFPGARRRGLHLPHAAIPFGLGTAAVSFTLLGWIVVAPSSVGNDIPALGYDPSSIRSIAYTVPGPVTDDVVVQTIAPGQAPQVVASFPNGGPSWPHARGHASPSGDRVAVLWLPVFATSASLTIVDLVSRESRQVEGEFEYLSTIAWSPDGGQLAVTATARNGEAGHHTVVEIDTATLHAAPVAEFDGAMDVAPVGYSFDGERLFTVVVDQRGSNLYAERAGTSELVAELSPGRTRAWSLSPDGARLAFVDELSGGSRNFVGRTLILANKSITTLPAEKNQLGSAWMPGSPQPAFGGPGGSLQFTDPAPDAAYLVPEAWSPTGSHLVATVYSEGADTDSGPSTALELISRETASSPSVRARISEIPGAEFLGFVRDLN